VLHQIGVGALGPVFRTYEPSRDRLVAVKVFRLDITPEQAQTLADELTRAAEAGLFHPSIVEPVAAGVQGTVAYRAEEYVPAESLDVAMGHYAPATPDKVLPFITQLAGAIDFARAAGVGHGALHPRDIFVTPDEARATGFGVVDALERVGLRAPVRRPYSPPERIAGEAWETPADVFSLAAIAFELLTGRRPSGTGDQIGAIAGAGRTHAVLARAMHEDPSKRYSTALEFAEALERAAHDETPVSEAVVPPEAAAATPAVAASVATPARETGAAVDATAAGAASQPGVEDDITAEREEDEAHWDLALKEQESTEIEADQPAELFADEQVEAAADSLALEAADLALDETPADEPFLNEFESEEGKPRPAALSLDPGPAAEEEQAASRDAPTAPNRSFIPVAVPPATVDRPAWPGPQPRGLSDAYDRPLAEEESRESRIVVERTRTAMLPIAVSLMVGLPLAFAAGYIVRGREAAVVPTASTTEAQASDTAPAASPPPGQGTPAGKEWSEQAVAQPSTRPAAPSATPDVPTEAPAAAPERTETAPPAPAAPRTGRIVVRSTPSRAGVTVNGIWRGRTPLTLDDLSFGDYVVRVVADGYQIRREEFSLSASNASRTLSMQLERQRPPAARGRPNQPAPRPAAPAEASPGTYFGVVFVDSRPQGAKVLIAGKEYGKTPLRIPEVPIGSHVVRLELPDHSSWTKPIRVAAGQEVRVTGSLEPIR
jgi:hypothetical protein